MEAQLAERLERLTDIVRLTLAELDARKTGWYYHLQAEMQTSRKLLQQYKQIA